LILNSFYNLRTNNAYNDLGLTQGFLSSISGALQNLLSTGKKLFGTATAVNYAIITDVKKNGNPMNYQEFGFSVAQNGDAVLYLKGC